MSFLKYYKSYFPQLPNSLKPYYNTTTSSINIPLLFYNFISIHNINIIKNLVLRAL